MKILEFLKFLPSIISPSLLREPFLHRFIPSDSDIEKITDYLLNIRKELRAKEATILEQKLALLQIPYLKHLELRQIEFWEKNYPDDLDLLFDLYVSQGIMHQGLRRIRWDEPTSSYQYINSFAHKNTEYADKLTLKLKRNKLTSSMIIFALLLLGIFFLNHSHSILLVLQTFLLMIMIILATLIVLIKYRDHIVVEATERIINKYPDLIQKYDEDIDHQAMKHSR